MTGALLLELHLIVLSDPHIIDKTVDLFYKKVDYAANTIPPLTRRWPDGSDVEVFSKYALAEAFKNAKGNDREHVTFYMWEKILLKLLS